MNIHSNDPYAALRIPSFRRILLGRLFLTLGIQIQAVSIGWLLYALHQEGTFSAPRLKYYVQRHIDVDGDHHSHLAIRMDTLFCDTEVKKQEAHDAIIAALKSRGRLS